MVDATRALLDELMGKERDVPLTSRTQRKIRWDDSTVCKYQLCGLCPSKLFVNTKSALGPCEYEVHDDHLEWENIMDEFKKADPRDIERYERKTMKYLDDLIREMDRKIAKNKERAEKESAPRQLKPDDQVKLTEIKTRAKEALEKAEALAEEGEVDQAQLLQQQAETYNKQHDEMFKRMTAPEKFMLVCDICGVFINSTDNEQRRRDGLPPTLIMDHLEGKQYLGWKAIRERYAELLAKYGPGGGSVAVREGSTDRDRERERERADRDRDRSGSDRRDRDTRDYRERDRERDYRDRDRDRRDPRDRDYRSRDSYSSRDRDRDYREPYRESDRRRY